MRIAKTVCITLPPELLKKAQKTAAREHRTMSELIREALRHYMVGTPAAEKASRPVSRAAHDAGAAAAPAEADGSLVVHSFRMEKSAPK